MASDLKIAALGRPFTLGMLYNAPRDKLIPGGTLWDDGTLQGKITEKVQPFSSFTVTTSDTIDSKSSQLDVEASLKASFLSGLIEVEGSAKYLNYQKKFKNQSRVTLEFKSTTNFKKLSALCLAHKDAHVIDHIKNNSATHIVTEIVYGANAFFVFDSQKITADSVKDLQGNMKAVIDKIPKLSVEGSAGIKLTDEEKAVTGKFSCKFFGDFNLKSNPVTYEDAVKAIVQLPQLLGEKGEKAVPVTVWLMPLKKLHHEAAELKSEISFRLIRKMQDALEDLSEMQMRCNDSLEGGVVGNFQILQEEFETFQMRCRDYASKLKRTMAEKFPSIREGEDESAAEKVLDDRHDSPFSQEKLSKWLDDKERQMNVIGACVNIMKGTKIVRSKTELDREVLSGEDVVCYVFTSTKKGDTFLDEMAAYLGVREEGSTVEDHWCCSDEVFTKMRALAERFYSYATAWGYRNYRFLITAIPNEKYEGATVYHYQRGVLLKEDWFS
ncbi:stonustoxin subunit alpha-like [Clinocottus analis]|uniref:stonustoxin subunit alpha-like n=1 Tax=Clinocottus analis TaxID=304258 RepID=UPI0035BF4981